MHTSDKHRSESFKHTCGDRLGFDPDIWGKEILFHITIRCERQCSEYLDCTAPWFNQGDLGLEINKWCLITVSGGGKGTPFGCMSIQLFLFPRPFRREEHTCQYQLWLSIQIFDKANDPSIYVFAQVGLPIKCPEGSSVSGNISASRVKGLKQRPDGLRSSKARCNVMQSQRALTGLTSIADLLMHN